jgi:chromosome segregation ATPase
MALPKFSQLERNLYAKLFENKANHSDAMSDLQARLDEAEEALTRVAYERNVLQCTVNELQERYENLSLELDKSRSVLSRESADWREEKLRMINEKVKLKNRNSVIENMLVVACDQRAALEAQKTDIERELSRELSETEGKHNKTIADIQTRFQDTVSWDLSCCIYPLIIESAQPSHLPHTCLKNGTGSPTSKRQDRKRETGTVGA